MPRVAIIGGGIGGLTAANALSRAGVEVCGLRGGRGTAGDRRRRRAARQRDAGAAVHRRRGGRAQGRGRTDYAVTRDGITGRVISRTSRARQAELQGIERRDRAPGRPARRARRGAARRDRVRSASGASRVESGGVVGGRAVRGRERRSRPTSSSAPTASTRRCGRRCSGRTRPGSPGRSATASVIPAAAVRGGALSDVAADNGQWLGPHGTIVLYPLRGEELINVVCHYDDDAYRHESWVTRVRARRGARAVRGLARVAAAAVRGRGHLVQVGAVRPRPDPAPGPAAGSRCSATPRTRCCPTWGRAPARRSRTARCWPPPSPRSAADPLAGAGAVRADPAAEGVPGGAHRRARGAVQPPGVALGRACGGMPRSRCGGGSTGATRTGRGAAWLAEYDATSPDVLAAP